MTFMTFSCHESIHVEVHHSACFLRMLLHVFFLIRLCFAMFFMFLRF